MRNINDISKKIFTSALIAVFVLAIGIFPVYSQQGEETANDVEEASSLNVDYPYDTSVIRSRDYISFDNKLSETLLDEYKEVKEVHVIYITAPNADVRSDGEEWVKGLYYYMITKMHFPDVPFNFVVTHDGAAYEGKYGASDVQPFAKTSADDKGKVVVAYLGLGESYDIEYAGQQKLKDVLGYLSSYYNVSGDRIIASEWSTQESTATSIGSEVILEKLPQSHRWASKVASIKGSLTKYPSLKRSYSAEKVDVVADAEAEVGKTLKVVAEFRNTGKFPWYKSASDQLILYVKGKKKSDYFVNKVWLSEEAPATLSTDWVLPGQKGQFIFELAMPFVSDDYTESFELGTLNGGIIAGTGFDIKFKVVGGSQKLVEILPTGYDFLNLRDKPSSFSNVVARVTPGKKYLLVQEGESYYKIRTNDGTEGWVVKKYAKIVQ